MYTRLYFWLWVRSSIKANAFYWWNDRCKINSFGIAKKQSYRNIWRRISSPKNTISFPILHSVNRTEPHCGKRPGGWWSMMPSHFLLHLPLLQRLAPCTQEGLPGDHLWPTEWKPKSSWEEGSLRKLSALLTTRDGFGWHHHGCPSPAASILLLASNAAWPGGATMVIFKL